MEQKDTEQKQAMTFCSKWAKWGVFKGIALGLLLLVISFGIENREVNLAGTFILPLALFWGGLFLREETTALRITLLAISGLLLITSFGGFF